MAFHKHLFVNITTVFVSSGHWYHFIIDKTILLQAHVQVEKPKTLVSIVTTSTYIKHLEKYSYSVYSEGPPYIHEYKEGSRRDCTPIPGTNISYKRDLDLNKSTPDKKTENQLELQQLIMRHEDRMHACSS